MFLGGPLAYDFTSRLDYLGTRGKTLHVNSLIYNRLDVFTPITITNFTPEKLDVTQLASMGVVLITDKAQDFIFDFAELAVLVNKDPKTTDQILWKGVLYETLQIGDEVFSYVTSSRKRIRVHSRQVSKNDAGIILDGNGDPVLGNRGEFMLTGNP